MDINNLTEEQAAQIYSAITSSDTVFLQAMARAAIQSSLDVAIDMYDEMPVEDRPVLDREHVHEMAAGYAGDMLAEFSEQLIKAISETKFEVVTMIQFK